jgi:aspartyl protease family protein
MRNKTTIAVGVVLTVVALLVLYLDSQYPGTLSDRDNQIDLASRLGIIVLLTGSLIVMLRSERFSSVVRSFLVWGGLALALIVGYSYWEEIAPVAQRVGGNLFPSEPRVVSPGTVALRAGTGRHFRAVAEVNGQRVQFLVDTGASDVALTKDDARRIGLDPDRLNYTQPYRTANGTSFGAPVRIDRIKIGDIVVDDVAGSVTSGELSQSLLGMTFLRRLSGFEVRGDELILRR